MEQIITYREASGVKNIGMRYIYNTIIRFYFIGVRIAAIFNRKARLMLKGQEETDGILRDNIDNEASYIWFHAASLGEFEQGRPIMERLKSLYPHYKILLTFFSPSGYEVRKNYPLADIVCYLPFDTPHKVRRFLDLAHPVTAVFIKYEFWYNYLTELNSRWIPTYCVSAIFRPEQWFFQWYGRAFLKALNCFDRIFVQDDNSEHLLRRFGIEEVTVSGDARFDRVMDVRLQAKSLPLVEAFASQDDTLTLVVGSSWPPDEDVCISYFNEHPEIKLIIAPHETNNRRISDIISALRRPSVRLSEATEENVKGKDCLIIDSIGVLSSVYRYGNLAYIGGGFGKGIHNVLEAAVYGIPVIFGPNYGKFKEARDLISADGAFPITGKTDFNRLMTRFLSDPDAMKSSGDAAGSFVSSNIGATNTILSEIF
jgi:3-deoxy-D-manno-octulosonic-acid transferase